MEGQCAVPHVVQDTNTETGTTALRRIPMIDPQPHTPNRLTFEAQDTVTNVAEPTVIDHGSHNVDVPVQRHLQKTGQPRGAELRLRCRGEVTTSRSGGRGGARVCWRKQGPLVCSKRARDNKGVVGGARQRDAAEMQKKGKGALDGNGKQQRTGWEGRVVSEGREGGVEKGTGAQREGGATDPSTTEDGGLATSETGTSFEKRPTASDNHRDIMEKTSRRVTSS